MSVGRVLDGRYQLDELLGSGGMGTVWRGVDRRLGRPVAVKELTGRGLADSTALRRFDREARTVARLTHPHIVGVYDLGSDNGHPYLVMELVEGRSVAELLADGPLPLAQALSIAAQTCDGLTAAHRAGVVHRDIKPANLLVTAAGVVKICDFGIARLEEADGENSLTGTAVAIGSSKFMAPEQATGGPVDGRADLYGLGCTLYAMLAGAPPFVGETAIGIVHQHLTQPPEPLRGRRADVPPELETLVAELLAKSPADRPVDAAETRRRLATIDSAPVGVPAVARPAIAEPSGGLTAGPTGGTSATLVAPTAVPTGEWAAGLDRNASLPGSPGRGPGRWLAATAAAAVLATGAVALALALGPPGGGPDDSGQRSPGADLTSGPQLVEPPPIPSASSAAGTRAATNTAPAPSASSGTGTTIPSSSAAPSTAQPPDPLTAIRAILRQQLAAGAVDRKSAEDLSRKVDDIETALVKNDVRDANRKINDMRHKLGDLLAGHKLDQAGHDALVDQLDQVAASLR